MERSPVSKPKPRLELYARSRTRRQDRLLGCLSKTNRARPAPPACYRGSDPNHLHRAAATLDRTRRAINPTTPCCSARASASDLRQSYASLPAQCKNQKSALGPGQLQIAIADAISRRWSDFGMPKNSVLVRHVGHHQDHLMHVTLATVQNPAHRGLVAGVPSPRLWRTGNSQPNASLAARSAGLAA